eukprot:m.183070 g.183070  ORF g.183070 m.183070 type:complete len:52 (-) comp14987_c0_seq1:29-184(-)
MLLLWRINDGLWRDSGRATCPARASVDNAQVRFRLGQGLRQQREAGRANRG